MVALVLPVFLERLPYLAKDRLLGKLLASEEQRVQLPQELLHALVLEHCSLHVFEELEKACVVLARGWVSVELAVCVEADADFKLGPIAGAGEDFFKVMFVAHKQLCQVGSGDA